VTYSPINRELPVSSTVASANLLALVLHHIQRFGFTIAGGTNSRIASAVPRLHSLRPKEYIVFRHPPYPLDLYYQEGHWASVSQSSEWSLYPFPLELAGQRPQLL
jgi:hypothetical protein